MIQLLMRAAGPQKRGGSVLKMAEGPQKPSARARMMAPKGQCILVEYQETNTFFDPLVRTVALEVPDFSLASPS